jgi:hypothetical protein
VAQLEQYWLQLNGVEVVEPAGLAWPYGSLERAEQANEIKTVVQVQAICQGIRQGVGKVILIMAGR